MKRNAFLNPHQGRGFILPAVIVVSNAFVILLLLASILFIANHAQAANGIQKTINFQGKVTNSNGTNVTDGAYDFEIKIYDGAGNSASSLYTETWSNAALFSSTMGTAPSTTDDSLVYSSNSNESTLRVGQILWNTTKKESVIITSVNTGTNTLGISRPIQNWANGDTITNRIYVKDGVFRVAINSLNADLSAVNFNSDSLFVGVNFNADGEMKPRMQLRSNAYAFNAEKVNGLTVTNTSDNPFSSTTILKINDGSTITFGGSFTTSGSNALTLTTTGSTSLTLPAGTDTLVARASSDTLTNKTIGNTGLTFDGATTDVTTGSNQDFVLNPNGTGRIGFGHTSPVAFFDLSNTGRTALGKALVIADQNEQQDLFTASASGTSRFTITRAGGIKLGTDEGDNTECLKSGGAGAAAVWGSCGISSKWTDGTGGIYYNSGNVGIGTTDPSLYKLFVQGTTNSKVLSVINGDGNQDLFTASVSGATKFLVDKTGNVGIGVTSPDATLDITGTINGSSALRLRSGDSATAPADSKQILFSFGGGANYTHNIRTRHQSNGTTGNAIDFYLWDQTVDAATDAGTKHVMSLIGTGNVGIGATTPLHKLHVSGTTNQTALAAINGDGNQDLFTASRSGVTRFVVDNTGNVGLGTTAPTNTLFVTRPITAGATGRALAIFDQIENQDILTASAGGTTRFVLKNDGTIGIGGTAVSGAALSLTGSGGVYNSTPKSLLRLYNSDASATNNGAMMTFLANRSGGIATPIASIGAVMTDATATGYTGALVLSVAGAGAVPTEAMRIISNGNVGIGLTNPSERLEVNSISGGMASISVNQVGSNDWAGYTIKRDNSQLWFIGMNSGDDVLRFRRASSTDDVVINTSGYLGIGTTSPGAYLNVANSGKTANGKAIAIFDQYESQDIFTASAGGTTRFTITNAGGIKLGTDEGDLSECLKSGGAGAAATWAACSGSGDWTVSGGKVYPTQINNQLGIGTTTGADIISSAYFTRDLASGALGKALMVLNQTENADIFTASAAGTTRFVINNAGNVGIGTNAPIHKLHLSGTTNQTALAAVNGDGNQDLFTASVSGATKFLVDKAGNVGIGVTSTLASLDIKGLNSLASVGSEKITAVADRDFSSDTGKWTTPTAGQPAWKINVASSGKAVKDAPGTGVLTLNNTALDSAAASGNRYQVTFSFTTTASSGGVLIPSFGGSTDGVSVASVSSDSQSGIVQVVTATGTGSLTFTPSWSGWYGTIDDVSVKLVTTSSVAMQLQSSDGPSTPIEFRAGGSGKLNTFIGVNSGVSNTSGGSWNTALGANALVSNTIGDENTAVGANALKGATVGGANSAFGSNALRNGVNVWENSAFGTNAMAQTTTGSGNGAFGAYALTQSEGDYNSVFGYFAMANSTTGSYNNAFGYTALSFANGSYNNGFGYQALYGADGNYNIGIGYRAGDDLDTGSKNIVIGYDGDLASPTDSNQLNIGNLIWGTGLDGTGTTLSSGNIGIGVTAPAAKLDISMSTTSTTAGNKYANQIVLDNTGNVSTGTDYTYGQKISVSRSGASGGTIYLAGQDIYATGSGTLQAVYGTRAIVSGKRSVTGGYFDAYTNRDELTSISTTGVLAYAEHNGSGALTSATGISGNAISLSSGTISSAYGVYGYVEQSNAAAKITSAYGGYFDRYNAFGQVTNSYGLYVATPTNTSGTTTNNYGMYIQDQSGVGSTLSYNFYSAGANSKNYFAGNVGIGITNPTNMFHLTRPIASGATGKALAIFDQIENQDILTASAGGTTRFVIKSDGNVGIGTNTPSNKLFVLNSTLDETVAEIRGRITSTSVTAANPTFKVSSIDTGLSPVAIAFSHTNASSTLREYARISALPTNVTNGTETGDLVFNTLTLNTTLSEKLRIQGSGNVGIGTTAPSASLHVTRPMSFGANGKALAILDQIENQDILTASAGGLTRFVLKNSGNVGFGSGVISASASGGVNNGSGTVANMLGDQGSMVPNGGFEATNFNSTIPDGWVFAATNSATLAWSSNQPDQGSGNLLFTTTSTNQSAALYSACFPLSGAVAYNMYYSARTPNAVGGATVRGYLTTYTAESNCRTNAAPVTIGPASTATTGTTDAIVGGTLAATGTNVRWGRAHFFIASAQSGSNATANIDTVRIVPSTLAGGMDYAENFPADPEDVPQPGEIVSIQTGGVKDQVGKSSVYMDQKVIGIVATKPGLVLDDGTVPDPKVPVALAGRVPVKVSTAKGPIYAGDYLTTSDIPGVAVKATKSGPTIGKAMEDYFAAGIGEVTVFVNISDIYRPELHLTSDGDVEKATDTTEPMVAKFGVFQKEQKGVFSDVIAGMITATTIDVKQLMVNGVSLEQFIRSIRQNAVSETTQLLSPIHSVDRLHTNVISPVGDDSSVSLVFDDSQLAIYGIATESAVTIFDNKGNGTFSGTVTAGLSFEAPFIKTDVLSVKTITSSASSGLAIELGEDSGFTFTSQDQTVFSVDAEGNAVFSGKITGEIEGLELLESGFADQEARIAALEALLMSSDSASVQTESEESEGTTDVTIASDSALLNLTRLLEETNEVNAKDFDIRLLTVEGLSIGSSASVSGDLRVKSNALVEGILTVIDTLTASNLIVNGIAHFMGEVIFEESVVFEKTPTFNSDTAGYTVIPEGHKTVTVLFDTEYKEVPVITTSLVTSPLSDEKYASLIETEECVEEEGIEACQEAQDMKLLTKNIRYIVTDRSTKGFRILLPKLADEEYTFSWTALSVKKMTRSDATLDRKIEKWMEEVFGGG